MASPLLRRVALAAAACCIAAALPAAAWAQDAARPIPRGGRWQLRLTNGGYLFDVRPVSAAGDSLVVARLDTAPAVTRALALAEVEELRLVQPSTLRFQAGAESPFGELVGADDVVFSLAGVAADERRRIVDEVLRAAASPGARR
jgi:hypothetical protein